MLLWKMNEEASTQVPAVVPKLLEQQEERSTFTMTKTSEFQILGTSCAPNFRPFQIAIEKKEALFAPSGEKRNYRWVLMLAETMQLI